MNISVPVPVVTVCSVDAVLRETTAAGLLCDVPGAVVLQHDLAVDGVLRRTVYDLDGVRERATVLLGHGCLSCALREELLPALRRLVRPGWRPAAEPRPTAVVLALPVAAEVFPVLRALHGAGGGHPDVVPGAAAAAVLATVETGTLEEDLFGDALLAERGLALSAGDRRAVGEALAHQLEGADVVVAPEGLRRGSRAHVLLRHLAADDVAVGPVADLDPELLLNLRRPAEDGRGDLRRAAPTGAEDAAGVWTADLRSWRPFHPDRLREGLDALAAGRMRGRGRFWLPSRPSTLGVWDGAGGQLSLGAFSGWGSARPDVRLVITGVHHDADEVRLAFERALLTDAELSRGLDWWAGRDDGFGAWLDVGEEDVA
jgi:G3E family GTPase